MADDSNFVQETIDFHPCNTPRGMLYYKLSELTDKQQVRLNTHKLNVIRNNHTYLLEHPEIKFITTTLLKGILKERPKYHIHKFMVKHLLESWADIKKVVEEQQAEREKKLAIYRERMATLAYLKSLYDEQEVEEETIEEYEEQFIEESIIEDSQAQVLTVEKICRSILEEIIQNLETKDKHRVTIKVVDPAERDSGVINIGGSIDSDSDD